MVQNSAVKKSLTTATDGKEYRVAFYSLDMILAIGFRVRSKRGTQFRIWANTTRTTPSISLRNCLPRSIGKTLTVSSPLRRQPLITRSVKLDQPTYPFRYPASRSFPLRSFYNDQHRHMAWHFVFTSSFQSATIKSTSAKELRQPAWTKTDSENVSDNLQESKKIRKSHFTGCDVTIQNRKTHFTTCESQNRIEKPTLQVVMRQFEIGKATLQAAGAKIESEKPLYRLLWGISESETSPDNR